MQRQTFSDTAPARSVRWGANLSASLPWGELLIGAVLILVFSLG